jgi:putative transposase
LPRDKRRPEGSGTFVDPDQSDVRGEPVFRYRTVAHLLEFNKNTVQRVLQINGWLVRMRPVGFGTRIKALLSVAEQPNERWGTDLCRIWARRDGWTTLALVIDCCSRECWADTCLAAANRRPRIRR